MLHLLFSEARVDALGGVGKIQRPIEGSVAVKIFSGTMTADTLNQHHMNMNEMVFLTEAIHRGVHRGMALKIH